MIFQVLFSRNILKVKHETKQKKRYFLSMHNIPPVFKEYNQYLQTYHLSSCLWDFVHSGSSSTCDALSFLDYLVICTHQMSPHLFQISLLVVCLFTEMFFSHLLSAIGTVLGKRDTLSQHTVCTPHARQRARLETRQIMYSLKQCVGVCMLCTHTHTHTSTI